MRDHPRSLPITPDLAALVGDSWVGASLEGSAASTGTYEFIREGTATIATSIEDRAQGAERVIPMADFAVGSLVAIRIGNERSSRSDSRASRTSTRCYQRNPTAHRTAHPRRVRQPQPTRIRHNASTPDPDTLHSASPRQRCSIRTYEATDRQQDDILAAGVRNDLNVDHGISGARASRPRFDRALDALHDGDTLVIMTLDRLGQSTQNTLAVARELRGRGADLRALNLGGGDVDTATPMGSMLFTIMAARTQMELEIKQERVVDSVAKRREGGKDLGERPRLITNGHIRHARRLIDGDATATTDSRDPGLSRATF